LIVTYNDECPDGMRGFVSSVWEVQSGQVMVLEPGPVNGEESKEE
jgi:hypothetical protein